jgi:hypothetical protein
MVTDSSSLPGDWIEIDWRPPWVFMASMAVNAGLDARA